MPALRLNLPNPAPATVDFLQNLLRFARVVRRRKEIVLGALAIAALLGGLYYASATRYYQAKAQLLILQTGNEVWAESSGADASRTGLMPTYERLITSAVVLEGALAYLQPQDRVDLAHMPRQQWVAALRANLGVSSTRRTNLLEITYRSRQPRSAVAVVQAVLRSYLEFMERTHKSTAGQIIVVLTTEKERLEQQIRAKETELVQTQQRFATLRIDPTSKVTHPFLERVQRLNDALVEAQTTRVGLQATLATLQGAVQRGEDLQEHMLSVENVVGREYLLTALGISAADTGAQARLEQDLLDSRAELQTLSRAYGPNHPEIIELQARIRSAEEYLAGYPQRVRRKLAEMQATQLGPLLLRMVRQRLAQSIEHEGELRKAFEQANAEAVSWNGRLAWINGLELELDRLRQLHEALVTQISGVDLKQEHAVIRAEVTSQPVESPSPVSPRLPLVALVSLIGGVTLGLGAVHVLDSLDDRFRSLDELRTQIEAPVLAIIRRMHEEVAEAGQPPLAVHLRPESPEAEAFRTLRTALAFTAQETRRLVISSAEPGDGKSTLAANLAVAFAQAGKRTLLIECDLRRPGLSRLFDYRGPHGLAEVLRGEGDVAAMVADHLLDCPIPMLHVLPAGPRRANPAELLASPRMSDVLAWAEGQYDQVLIDSPPILAATDAAVVARWVDGLALVVRPDKNPRTAVLRALDACRSLGVSVLGVVVNCAATEGVEAGYEYVGYEYEPQPDEHATIPPDEADIAEPNPAVVSVAGVVPVRRAA